MNVSLSKPHWELELSPLTQRSVVKYSQLQSNYDIFIMKNKTNRCNYRDWPIRRQLMFSFLCTTILLQMILLVVIFVNLEVMIKQTDDQVAQKVSNQTAIEFSHLGNQVGLALQAHLYLLASQLATSKQFFFEFFNPLNNYTALETFKLCNTESTKTYLTTCYYIPQDAQSILSGGPLTLRILGYMQNYDLVLPHIFTPYFRPYLLRFSIFVANPDLDIAFYMIYPSENITSYSIVAIPSQQIELYGPYLNPVNKSEVIMSLVDYESYEGYNIYFNIEFQIDTLSSLFSDINFYQQSFVLLTDSSGSLIYAPQEWQVPYTSSLQKVYNYPQYCGFDKVGIALLNDGVVTLNQTQYLMTRIAFSGTYTSYQLSSFIENLHSQIAFYVYLYAPQNKMMNTYTQIANIMDREETSIVLLTMCSSIFTLAIVFIFTYLIAVRISRPLNKLITTAAFMSSNVTKKNITQIILKELNEITAENQIADLIQAFKNLVITIDGKNKSKKSNVKRQAMQYPLNQYYPEFINKTKNKSDVNWHNLLNEIEDD